MSKLTITIPDWLDRICVWPVMWYRRHKYGYSYRRIYLGEGQWTILDPQDYYRLGHLIWFLSGNDKKFYACRNIKIGNERTKTISMHREIMNFPEGLLVDHKNGESLDNRRENLRLATHKENVRNRRKTYSKTSSRFVGVYFEKKRGLWTAGIKYEYKLKRLGRFESEIDAAKAYDEAAKKYFGEFARLNFPNLTTESTK